MNDKFYAAGEIEQSFDYSVKDISDPQPINFTWEGDDWMPDNPQAFVSIDGELWQYRMNYSTNETKVTRYKGPSVDKLEKVDDIEPGFSLAWFMGELWYNKEEKKIYAPVHMERRPFNDYAGWSARRIGLVTSTDKGETWKYEGDIITSEIYQYEDDTSKTSGSYYFNGCSDYHLYIDKLSGYAYIYWTGAWFAKGDSLFSIVRGNWETHVSRCKLSNKLMPGKWENFHNGHWGENALAGKSSIAVPTQGLNCVIYSESLKKYIIVGWSWWAGSGVESYGCCISTCSSLEKQDWEHFGMFDEMDIGAFSSLFNKEGTDMHTCDDTFRFYAYIQGAPGMKNFYKALLVTLKEGNRKTLGYVPQYTFEPHPESSDEITGRKTKIVSSVYPELKYTGNWQVQQEDKYFYYEGFTKYSNTASSSVELSFKGSDIFLRALRNVNCGICKVYIDNEFVTDADLYFHKRMFSQFVFYKKGLEDKEHTIKIVVSGEKNPKATDTVVSILAFEYTAESYRASFGFCNSGWGKNNWYYEQMVDGNKIPMRFNHSDRTFYLTDYFAGKGFAKIGSDYQMPDEGFISRRWLAPHSGKIQIEAMAYMPERNSCGAYIKICHNETEVFANTLIRSFIPSTQEIIVDVKRGESIAFMSSTWGKSPATVVWDPVLTYIESINDEDSSPRRYDNGFDIAFNRRVFARTDKYDAYFPGDGSPCCAVDGNSNTKYHTRMEGDNYIMLDLEETCYINRWIVKHIGTIVPQNPYYGSNTRNFCLQKSIDGINFTTVDSVVDNRADLTERTVEEFTARYVRLYITKPNYQLYEPTVNICGLELYCD